MMHKSELVISILDPYLHALPEKHVEQEKKFARGRVLENMATRLMDGISIEEEVIGSEIRFTAVQHSYHPRELKRMLDALNELRTVCTDATQQGMINIISNVLTQS